MKDKITSLLTQYSEQKLKLNMAMKEMLMFIKEHFNNYKIQYDVSYFKL
jgi:hypothetical protein